MIYSFIIKTCSTNQWYLYVFVLDSLTASFWIRLRNHNLCKSHMQLFKGLCDGKGVKYDTCQNQTIYDTPCPQKKQRYTKQGSCLRRVIPCSWWKGGRDRAFWWLMSTPPTTPKPWERVVTSCMLTLQYFARAYVRGRSAPLRPPNVDRRATAASSSVQVLPGWSR